MISRNATDAVMAALDDAKVIAWRSDSQYEALCMAVHDAISGQVDAAIAAKDSEIARLRDALAPFAEISKHFNDGESGLIHGWHSTKVGSSEISVEHVHAARAALAVHYDRLRSFVLAAGMLAPHGSGAKAILDEAEQYMVSAAESWQRSNR